LDNRNKGDLINERYKILEQIGDGSEAFVYKCEDFKEIEGQFKM